MRPDNLEQLSKTLLKLQVFEYKKVNGRDNVVGLSISISGEKREYQYADILTPVIGYVRKYENENSKTRVKGIKGIERAFDEKLNDIENGVIKGTQDVITYINLDKTSTLKKRKDGDNIKLTIPIKLQKNIEIILDKHKEKLNADEIIVSIMESKTGKILALASSNRFNPENILQSQIPNLNVKAIEYPFEPGSVIKPISISLALDKNRVKDNELFFAYNKGIPNQSGEYPKASYKIDKFTIKDDHRFKKQYLTLKDIVVNSSNIGTLQIANRLSGKEFLEGLHDFGFGLKTNIELPYERVGVIPSLKKLSAGENLNKDNVYKSTVSYGQGMTSTFMQVMKAYSVFNNNGKIITPFITENQDLKNSSTQIISSRTANKMKKLLVDTVNEGTGRSTFIEGLEIGGKTGTAQIARKGSYLKEYISSFFGFVNDQNLNSYTIGVTVFNPNSKGKKYYQYYASQSAVPVFKDVIEILIKLYMLKKK